MINNQRFREVVFYLKNNKYIRNQQDFTERVGSDKSTVSQIMNEKIGIPNSLFASIETAFPFINGDWIKTGEGEMLVNSGISASIDGSHNQINGHGAHGNFNGCESSAILSERVKSLEALLAEKERLIKVLMEGRK